MNKRDEIKIEVLSSIDDQIIDKQTDKRYRLMLKNRMSRKKLIGFSGAAAGLLVACSLIFALWIPIFSGKVPVYEGMTVSNTDPTVQLKAEGREQAPIRRRSEPTFFGAAKKMGFTPHVLLAEETVDVAVTETETKAPDLMGENHALYYAKKNEDIYITVHLKNPEEYEILSFTLNGTKYQSYMFEQGSTSEQLVLKVNVGEAQGLTEYTIDAIKYVDGTEIKDVRMEGDRTVTVAVYPENQPKPEVTNFAVDYETVSFGVLLEDEFDLIHISDGKATAYIYQGNKVICEQELLVGEKMNVTFTGLTPGVSYVFRIEAEYDSWNGMGVRTYTLHEEELITKSHVSIRDVVARDGKISFHLSAEAGATVTTVELLKGGYSVVRTGGADVRAFDHLPLGSFSVRATYIYGENGAKTGYTTSQAADLGEMCPMTEIVKGAERVEFYETLDTFVYSTTTVTTKDADKSVYAPFDGYVYQASYSNGSGFWRLTIRTILGDVELQIQGLGTISVEKGDTVTAGQKLGTIGSHQHRVYEGDKVSCYAVHLSMHGGPVDDVFRIPEKN